MFTVTLENIPRLYTALADWLACLLYMAYLPVRVAGPCRYMVQATFLVGMCAFMEVTGTLPLVWFLPCIAVSALIMYLFLLLCAKSTPTTTAYYCVRAFALGELAASLEWQLYYFFATRLDEGGWLMRYGVLIATYGGVFIVTTLLERNYSDRSIPLLINQRELTSTLVLGIAIYAASNLSYVSRDTPFSGIATTEIFNIRTLVDLGGVAVLMAHHMQIVDYRRRQESAALKNVLRAQYAQYRSSQESVELINRKYHDLKHQIALLRSQTDDERSRYLDAMEREIRSYEAQNKTGNEVLDTILTAKSLYCQQHDISLTSVADGAALDFMDTLDLCSLFGNALDNAIESTEKLPDPEQRLIRLLVTRQKEFVWVRVENTYDGVWQADGDLPRTTKSDRAFHGYGLKSIYQIAARYSGTAEIETRGEWFVLKVLLLPNAH